jgi:hypothetical protein
LAKNKFRNPIRSVAMNQKKGMLSMNGTPKRIKTAALSGHCL